MPEYRVLPLTPWEIDASESSDYGGVVEMAYIEASVDSGEPTTRTQEKEGFLVREVIN